MCSNCNKSCNSNCEDTCNSSCESKQIDTSDIFYKIKCGTTQSPLSPISITKGMSLQTIIEILGLHIINEVEIANPVVEGQPTITTYQQVIDYLISLNNARIVQINSLQSQINTVNTTILAINDRLVAIEKPKIIDTKGLGFTVNSPIQLVLQKFSDNI